MALLDSAHRVSTVRQTHRTAPKGGIHPSVCVVSGFGVIIASALAVHVVFNAIF